MALNSNFDKKELDELDFEEGDEDPEFLVDIDEMDID